MSKRNSLMWSASLNENHNLYIFGTVHLRKHEYNPFIDRAKFFIQNCTDYYSEIDLDSQDVGASDILLDVPLLESNSKHFLKLNKRFLKLYSHDLSHLENQPDFFINQYITQFFLDNESGPFMDQTLWDYARSCNCVCSGLEQVNDQVKILKLLLKESSTNELKRLSCKLSAYKKSLLKIHDAYMNQDIVKLYKLSVKSLGKNRKILLKYRNLNMAKTIARFDQNKTAFVSVGAAHLAGKYGLIALLKRTGYKFQAIQLV